MFESTEELKKIYESSPFNNYLGIQLDKYEEGSVVYSLKVLPHHNNVNQGVHGGVYFSILDAVMGATVRSITKKPITTINSTINFISPLTEGNQMIASANLIKSGKNIAFAEGEVRDCNGLILANSVGVFKIMNHHN